MLGMRFIDPSAFFAIPLLWTPLVDTLSGLSTARSDPDSVHRAAHALKTLGATFGATDLARLCQQVETDTGSNGELGPLVSKIAAEQARVALALRALD